MAAKPAARWLLPAILLAVSLVVHLGHASLVEALWPGTETETIRLLSGAAAYFAAAWLGSRLVGLALDRPGAGRRRAPRLLKELTAAALFLVAIIATAVLVFGQPTSSVLAGSGLLIAIMGFAIRNVVADVLSGVALGLEAPYRIGDWVEIDTTIRGRVVEIGWRTTRLLTRDDMYMILPNSQIARQRLTNYSAPRRHYRTQVPIVLDHGIPVAEARTLLADAASRARGIMASPAPDARVIAYEPEGIRYAVRYWVPSFAEDVDCRDAVLSAVDSALRKRRLPPPHMRLHVAGGHMAGGR